MLLMVRLGLRVGEVAAMQLEDIDWRCGELVVGGKGNRHESLPLLHDVGEALVSHLRRRPQSERRALSLRISAPRGSIGERGVSDIVRRACTRAGLPPTSAHRLRHTVATEMLRAGGSLTEIQQVLRHSQLQTTSIYAKVDRAALRRLARPWPGSAA